MRCRVLFALIIAPLPTLGAQASLSPPTPPPPIADNSFLIEEAYNQEPGVVQHISVFTRDTRGTHWSYAFTQEWPLGSQRHQLSYTIPLETATEGATGAGIADLQIHYRHQLADGARSGVAIAPRVSLLVPTGDEERGRGAGAAGVQVNLPVSAQLGPTLVVHWNAGATHTPDAHNPLGDRATTTAFSLGQGIVWLIRPTFNFLLEIAWQRGETVVGPSTTAWESGSLVAPGIRGALNFPSGLQIVPGLSVPIPIGPLRGDPAILAYLSIEHAFRK